MQLYGTCLRGVDIILLFYAYSTVVAYPQPQAHAWLDYNESTTIPIEYDRQADG